MRNRALQLPLTSCIALIKNKTETNPQEIHPSLCPVHHLSFPGSTHDSTGSSSIIKVMSDLS